MRRPILTTTRVIVPCDRCESDKGPTYPLRSHSVKCPCGKMESVGIRVKDKGGDWRPYTLCDRCYEWASYYILKEGLSRETAT